MSNLSLYLSNEIYIYTYIEFPISIAIFKSIEKKSYLI